LILTVTPPAPLSPELPQIPTPVEEPHTVPRLKGKRRGAKKNGKKNLIIISIIIILLYA
jgi:hypothetical protein